MCGIVGYIATRKNAYPTDRKRFLTQGLVIDALRGDDSTGAFSVAFGKEGGSPAWAKAAQPGGQFVRTEEYGRFVKNLEECRWVVGHNRAATQGTVSTANAHPFQEGPITMVHNGTLRGDGGLATTQAELKVEVDSHAICHNLALAEPDAAHEVVEKIRGGYTLVWHDSRNSSLNIARNYDRPLHMAVEQSSGTLYFASEGDMLVYLAKRIHLNIGTVISPKPGMMLTFTEEGGLLPKFKALDLTKAVPSYQGVNYGGYDGWNAHGSAALAGSRGAPRLPKSLRQPRGPTAYVGGRQIPLPNVCVSGLWEVGLDPELEQPFIPMQIENYPTEGGRASVHGHLPGPDMHGIVLNMAGETARKWFDQAWSVVPLAVYTVMDDGGRRMPVAVCSLRASRYSGTRSAVALAAQRSRKANKVPGPDNTMIPLQEWLSRTAGGCVECHDDISFEDRELIRWKEKGPLCAACSCDKLDDDIPFDYGHIPHWME